MSDDPRDLDAATTVRLLETMVYRRRRAEIDDLHLVLHYADLHSTIPAPTGPGGATLGDLGGQGTPGVSDLAVIELGVARHTHPHAARSVVADALDLRHRLPRTFEALETLDAEVWVARKIARITRQLSYDAVASVDHAVAEAITGHSPAKVIELAEAKTIEADRAAHDARVAAARKGRYVGLSRPDTSTGHQTLYARVPTGDAHDVFTQVQAIADLLATREPYADLTADELRAEAFTWLSRPDDVLALLAGDEQPRRFRRKIVLYVHLSEAALVGVTGIARTEGLGPISLQQLRDLVGHHHIDVKPVIDLNHRTHTTAYEHPEDMKERLHLRYGGDAFPHANSTSRKLDHDHITPYRRRSKTGPPASGSEGPEPPAQTTSHTSQPLSRTPHRAKTHLRYRCRQTETGEVIWTTPHGLHRIVDHTGTHPITDDQYTGWFSTDPLHRPTRPRPRTHRPPHPHRPDLTARVRAEPSQLGHSDDQISIG